MKSSHYSAYKHKLMFHNPSTTPCHSQFYAKPQMNEHVAHLLPVKQLLIVFWLLLASLLNITQFVVRNNEIMCSLMSILTWLRASEFTQTAQSGLFVIKQDGGSLSFAPA